MIPYLRLQLKRALGTSVHVLALTLLLALSVALIGTAALKSSEERRERVRIGVTGDTDDRYVRMGLELIGEFDTSRFSISFEPMEESEARALVRAGTLGGFLRIPEGFVDALLNGTRIPMTFVSGSGGIGALLSGEIASAVSRLLLETENALYGVQRYSWETDPARDWYGESMVLFDRYVGSVLDRSDLFHVEALGVSHSLTLAGSLFCGLMIAVTMLWGIGASPFFTRRSPALSVLLQARGVGCMKQVIAEYLAFLALSAAGALALTALGGAVLHILGQPVPELRDPGFFAAAGIFLRALPALLLLTAMSLFLYELVPGTVGACLALFLNAAAQGFAAGCFYPASFLPEAVSAVGEWLPAGIALRALASAVTGLPDVPALLSAALWWAAFLLLSALLRRRRGEAGT